MMVQEDEDQDRPGLNLNPYAGRWVALLKGRIVGQGGTPQQALHAAKTSFFKETPDIQYVATPKPLNFDPIFEYIRSALPVNLPVYLVGGAVRDALIQRNTHDLDFVLPEKATQAARKVAAEIGAAYYPLDAERDTARLVFFGEDNQRFFFDFSSFRGPDLESDLRLRDFTINAMAVDIRNPQELLDPLGGGADLAAKLLRQCSPNTVLDDPVRILRAVRLANNYQLKILPETRRLIRNAGPMLSNVSVERLRDELFKILDGLQVQVPLRALDLLGVMPQLLPELVALKGLEQSPPHTLNAWDHTFEVVKRLMGVLAALAPEFNPDNAANLFMGLAVIKVGRYREQIGQHLNTQLNPDRSPRALLALAALYHDVGKAGTRQVDSSGKAHFYQHETIGAQIIQERAQSYHLSNLEIERLQIIVRHHMRPAWLARQEGLPPGRAVYRFFRDTEDAGVDICLISMADVLGTYGTTLTQEKWSKHLDVIRTLLEAWFERPHEKVAPPPLIDGNDLISEFKIAPGPLVGELLDQIQEAQAEGQVNTREQALELVAQIIEKRGN